MNLPPLTPAPARLIVRSEDPHTDTARRLIDEMCAELIKRYQRPPSTYLLEEAAAPRAGFMVAWLDDEAIGCGALRCIDETTVEVKRMYVAPAGRRRGAARRILAELERIAAGFGYARIRLETGIFQPEAIALYDSSGYQRTPPYGRYIDNPEAVCFEKRL